MAYQILIRPKRATANLRIYYIAPPVTVNEDDDTAPLSARWRELLVLGAAMRLMSRDGECTDDQRVRHARLMDQFNKYANRQQGYQTIRRTRR